MQDIHWQPLTLQTTFYLCITVASWNPEAVRGMQVCLYAPLSPSHMCPLRASRRVSPPLFPLRGASPFQHLGTDSTQSCDRLYLPLVVEFLLQVLVFMDHLIPMFLSAISLPSTSSFVLESMKSLVKGCEAITK